MYLTQLIKLVVNDRFVSTRDRPPNKEGKKINNQQNREENEAEKCLKR